MKFFCFCWVFAAASVLSSCGSATASLKNADGRPTVLRYCFTSTNEEPEAGARRLEILKRYLSKTLNLDVEVVQTTQYGAVVEAFRANKVDVAAISPFSYVLASEKAPIEAILMRERKDGSREYSGSFVVAADSPLHTVDDMIKHSKELTIAFVDPVSTSGFLMQNAFLQSRGLDPQRDFKKVMFSMNHLASVMTLKAHKVDVAATSVTLMKRAILNGKLAEGDVRIIWTSPPIPNQPIALRKDLPAKFKEEIRRAFVEMPQRDPEAWENMYPKAYAALNRESVYVPANDAMFDGLRAIAKGVKNLSLLDR
jgi:phosphonate transport system substrate-binding protein